MIVFQYLALPILIGLILWDLLTLRRSADRRFVLVRIGIWLAALVAIAMPELTHTAATAVGITRGADLVFYLSTLAFLCASFYFYARYVRLQRQMTEIVRHLALREAQEPPR